MIGCQAWDSDSRGGKSVYFSETEDDEIDYEAESDFFDDEDEEEENRGLAEWLKEWSKKEHVSEKIRRIAKR